MKRDLDLCRQLLLDIEGRGVDCALSVVRTGADHDGEPRIKHHLRLLCDAGYLKEVDRTGDGVPCVRLTDAGYELIELVRSESRWHEAKRTCREATGGASLTVIREILVRWAVQASGHRSRRRYYAPAPEAVAERDYRLVERDWRDYREYREPPVRWPYRLDAYRDGDWEYAADDVRYYRVRPERRNGWRDVRAYDYPEFAVAERGVSLPEHVL